MGRQSGRERILSVLPQIVRFLVCRRKFEPGVTVPPNDLLDDTGGLSNGFWGTLKFEEKGVLDWIGSLDYASRVDGRHHYGSCKSDQYIF